MKFTLPVWLILLPTIIFSQVIPAHRLVDWTNAGLTNPAPKYATLKNISSFGGSGNGSTLNDAALQAAINSLANDSGIIYFPTGNYLFSSPVIIPGGIILRGAGASSSRLIFNLQGNGHAIQITGTAGTDTALLVSNANKGDDGVVVNAPGLFAAGDYVKLYDTDTALVHNDYAVYSTGQILQIKNMVSDTLFFHAPIRRNYFLAQEPRLRKLNMINGSGIECLAIKRLDSTAAKMSNIYIEYAAECWLAGIESDSSNFAHVQVANSTNIQVTGSYFHHAFGHGPNGQGYGISIEYSSGQCLVENNIFSKLRHAMLVQSGANGNVFAYNYSREAFKTESNPPDLSGDVVLHGNYPYANLFEGNIAENIIIDAAHGINGPHNTFFRNRATSYGILMSPGSGDSTNFVGNEITGVGFGKGNYLLNGEGNFEFGNNRRGAIIPAGTHTITTASYYYSSTPAFFNANHNWPPIGHPHAIGIGTIPAKTRYEQAQSFTICTPVYTYTFTGNGSWNDSANWHEQMVAPAIITAGIQVVINPTGQCMHNGPILLQPGGKMTIRQGKKLLIQ